MSGPKVSVYDLTPQQRAIIAAELQRRMRELERRQELLNELQANIPKVEHISQSLLKYDLVAKEETLHLNSSALSAVIAAANTSIKNLTQLMSVSADLQDNEKLEKNLRTIEAQVKDLQTTADSVSEQAANIAEKLQSVLTSSISELFAQQEEPDYNTEPESRHEQQFAMLQSYASLKHLPANLRQKIDGLIERKAHVTPDGMDGFFSVEVQPTIKMCEDFVELWEKDGAQYELLLQRYELLAKENGRDQVAVIPFSSNAIAEIAKLIALEEIEYQRQAEDAYIEDSISAVMEEMGYSIRGQREVTKRNGSHYSSSLFQYDHDSAVNVIFSDDGRITMEVGKTDTQDRIPESSESQSIVETMEAFCSDFAEIERRLAARGVILKNRIRLSPPAAEYAQVINVTDYSTVTTKSSPNQKRKVNKKPKQRSLQN